MAEIRVRAENGHQAQSIQGFEAQRAFLKGHGLEMEHWAISRLESDGPVEDEQAHILSTFQAEIERLKQEKGYLTADVISLRPQTPNLEAMLARFDKEHFHDDDEVRFVVDGRGVFTIHSQEDGAVFDVEVHPGDLLIVPEGTWHWFTLCEDRQIKCIRLFKDSSGWVPHYL